MKIVSLKLARELRKAGYPQKPSTFYVKERTYKDKKESPHNWIEESYEDDFHGVTFDLECFASPTADEILEQLPIYFDCNSDNHRYHMRIHPNFNGEKNGKEIKDWIIGYRLMEAFGGKWHEKNPFGDASLADAAAKLWIYLKENDLLEDYAE